MLCYVTWQVQAWILKHDKFAEEHYTGPPPAQETNGYTAEEVTEHRLEAFQKVDKNGDGHVSPDELRVIMTDHCGEALSASEIDKMIRDADCDGDGEIDYEEFVGMMADAEEAEARPRVTGAVAYSTFVMAASAMCAFTG